MTQEEKQLILVDLCGRLPYGVKVQTTFINQKTKKRSDIGVDVVTHTEISLLIDGFEEHKPYLFPMSSMTDSQKTEWDYIDYYADHHEAVDWLNAHHFDYRGLIEKGLAIDATGLNIY